MIRTLSLVTVSLFVLGFSSCFPDKKEEAAKIEQIRKDIDELNAKIAELELSNEAKMKSTNGPLPENWKHELDVLAARKMNLDADLSDNDAVINELKNDRDKYTQRLQEFKITHPIAQ